MKINEINDFSNAKVGDPVTSIRYGKGVICDIDFDEIADHIQVNFNDKFIYYTDEGFYMAGEITPDLYKGHGHFNILFVPDVIEEISIVDKSNYRPYSKFVDLTGKKVISNNNETRLILESNRNLTYTLPEGNYDAQFLFDYFTFEDGSPCGELKDDIL